MALAPIECHFSQAHGLASNDGTRPGQAVTLDKAKSLLAQSPSGGTLVIHDAAGPLGSLDCFWNKPNAAIDATRAGRIACPNQSFIEAGCFLDRRFRGLTLKGLRVDGNGTGFGLHLTGPADGITLDGCDFRGFAVNAAIEGHTTARAKGLTVRRSIFADAWGSDRSQGLLVGHTDGALIEDCVFDRNGWHAPNMFSHNVYIAPENTSAVTLRRIITARASANGLRCCGTEAYDIIALDNPCGIVAAPYTKRVERFTILGSRDINPTNPLGIGLALNGCQSVYAGDGVVAHRSTTSTFNLKAVNVTGGGRVTLDRIRIDQWTGPGDPYGQAFVFDGPPPTQLAVGNCRVSRTPRCVWPTAPGQWAGNRWDSPAGEKRFMTMQGGEKWVTFEEWRHMTNAADSEEQSAAVPALRDFEIAMGWEPGGYYEQARALNPRCMELAAFVRA